MVVVEDSRPGETPALAEADRAYSPRTVQRWLDNWGRLNELALLTPPSTSRFRELTIRGKGLKRVDRMRYLHILADLQVAWANLEADSLEYWAVEAVIHGKTFRQAEHDGRLRSGALAAAYPRACRQMAESLGWRP